MSWEEIENQLELENTQEFYYLFKMEAENNYLTYIDDILKLRLILIGLPCENRYEIFKKPKIQAILNNFDAKDIVELYAMFPPGDSYQFLKSQYVISRLQTLLFSEADREDIISHFPVAMRDAVTTYLSANLVLSFMNPVYSRNQKSLSDMECSSYEECSPSKRLS